MLGNPSFTEQFFQNYADHSALASFTSEASLLAGTNRQAVIPRGFHNSQGKALRITAAGVLSVTGTPTFLFTNRIGSTIGASDLTGTAVGVSAAITCGSGITNQGWKMILDIVCRTPGQGANNTTVSCFGFVSSPGGFASPFEYMLTPGGGASATWTATLNSAVDLFPNLSVTCSASNAANTITCKEYKVEALN